VTTLAAIGIVFACVAAVAVFIACAWGWCACHDDPEDEY
jgi:hypothetical protein